MKKEEKEMKKEEKGRKLTINVMEEDKKRIEETMRHGDVWSEIFHDMAETYLEKLEGKKMQNIHCPDSRIPDGGK